MGTLATRRLSLWQTALRLGRVSNLPTVWSNVIAATALTGGAPLGLVVVLSLAGSLMYVGGMYLNDAFDRDIDARERPERPIPSGAVSADGVLLAGLTMLALGVLVLSGAGMHAGILSLALAAAILLYDWHHKRNPVAPFIMGLCRALLYIAAAAAITFPLPASVLLAAAATLAYVAALTFAARMEAVDHIASLWPLPMLLAPAVLAAVLTDSFSLPFALAVVALSLSAVRITDWLRQRAPGDVSRAVALLIAAISLNDALLAATTGAHHAAYACLACFALTLFLQRHVPAT